MGRNCPHCTRGQLFLEDGEAVCLQCGYREDATALPGRDGDHGGRRVEVDPFAVLVAAVQKTGEALCEELLACRERSDTVGEQIKRVEKALAALTTERSETGRKRNYRWSDEQRARHSERMKEAKRKKRQGVPA